jgi:ATP-dependent DNA helicase RecG
LAQRTMSAMLDFLSPISVIPGMGEKRVQAMTESGIETLGDLLYWFPIRYIDRSTITPINKLCQFLNSTCTVIGKVEIIRVEHGRRGRLRVKICDESGSMELLWFRGVQFFSKSIHKDEVLLVTGKATQYGHFQMVHPTIETLKGTNKPERMILPYYSVTSVMKEAGIQQKLLQKAILWILKNLKHFPQMLPGPIEKKKNFLPLQICLTGIHTPESLDNIDIHKERIKYEELYKLALTLRLSRKKFALPGRIMKPGPLPERMRAKLPFKLTSEQEKAINILFQDAASPCRMHRLLQGDVGSGKTLVAFFSSLAALNQGLQVAWLTPTDVLAKQTFRLVSSWLEPLGFSTSLLKSGLPAQQKQSIISCLASGATNCVIGTHALLQPSVKFNTLGMIIIDEQHKFGAQQRLTMQEKDPASDFLLMSATPIPQTLAKTLYGDLDIVSICKSPEGRGEISTHIVPDFKRNDMEQFVLGQLNQGVQAYYIVPRIEHDDELENTAIKDIESTYATLTTGTFSSVTVAHLHGKLGNDEKELVMDNFINGSVKLLLATSVVEVGIDVSNAIIIIIENAERFGLAQLHQLRGRVGRGPKKSFCFLLLAQSADSEAQERVKEFCKLSDGFKIAELDLRFRGPGEITGFKQSGWYELVFADIIKDADLFKEIQRDLDTILRS